MRMLLAPLPLLLAPAAAAQDRPTATPERPRAAPDRGAKPARAPRRIRVGIGPQLNPGFPGNNALRLTPMFSLSRTRGDRPFDFGAPGDGNAVTLLHAGAVEFGPLLRLEGRRREGDLGGGLPVVGRTVEAGLFAQTWKGDWLRLRGDVRKGIGGHEGWIGQIGADLVARDGDRWLASIGPRVVLADRRYQRAWFGVPVQAVVAGELPRYQPGGGLNSIGLASRTIYQLTPRWGVLGNVQYARLTEDAARSPVIRRAGSQDQLTLGLGATYTFTIR